MHLFTQVVIIITSSNSEFVTVRRSQLKLKTIRKCCNIMFGTVEPLELLSRKYKLFQYATQMLPHLKLRVSCAAGLITCLARHDKHVHCAAGLLPRRNIMSVLRGRHNTCLAPQVTRVLCAAGMLPRRNMCECLASVWRRTHNTSCAAG